MDMMQPWYTHYTDIQLGIVSIRVAGESTLSDNAKQVRHVQ